MVENRAAKTVVKGKLHPALLATSGRRTTLRVSRCGIAEICRYDHTMNRSAYPPFRQPPREVAFERVARASQIRYDKR